MSKFARYVVAFEDGTRIETQSSSRDLAALEKAGIELADLKPIEASYLLAHTTLVRLKRRNLIDIDVPATPEDLMDLADLEPVEDDDPEGKDSAPVPSTG